MAQRCVTSRGIVDGMALARARMAEPKFNEEIYQRGFKKAWECHAAGEMFATSLPAESATALKLGKSCGN